VSHLAISGVPLASPVTSGAYWRAEVKDMLAGMNQMLGKEDFK
jgi:hypothetical protein